MGPVTEALVSATHAAQERLKFNQNTHRYWLDGKPIVSTTTVTKTLNAPQLNNWMVKVQVEGTARAAYSNPPSPAETVEQWTERLKRIAAQEYEHQKIARETADDGHQVHALIEWRLRRMLGQDVPRPKVSEVAAFREAGWEKWAKDVQLKPVLIETRVFNAPLRYCGTVDLAAEMEGQLCLLDWKRAKGVWESHHLQSIAYRMALESMGWPQMPGYVLLMPEGQEIRPVRLSDSQETREAFLSCLKLYRWTGQMAKDKRGEGSR